MLSYHLSVTALALLFVLSALGWGDLLSRLAGRTPGTFWQDLVGRFVFGCTALYVIFVVLSLFGRLHRIEAGVAIGIGVAASCFGLYALATSAVAALASLGSWSLTDRTLVI